MSTDSATVTRKHAHHFKDGEHEFQSSILGVWLFLSSEILMFGALIVGYIIYSGRYPEMFAEGAAFLDKRYGAVNTVALLISSWTMVMGVRAAQTNNNKAVVKWLLATLFFASIFMVIKYLEYSHKFHLGIYPGKFFAPVGEAAGLDASTALYFSFYFCLTGLHGLHVLFGMIGILWVLLRARKNEFSENYYTPVEGVGLFWHLVDMVWIYLFPILYLI
ncbi:MAG: cytochrome C oxidase subunit III [Bdellovibrionaceae bacterium]|nr:cytochrome C oxidase subunit III [Pseudobdellovibrionaceae bacterium]|tara:strand:+ start:70886 stop:71542 length:657 start_codon:yes stop_codon:yes gene_type:complete